MSFLYADLENISRQELYSGALQRRFRDALLGMPLFNDLTSMFPDGDELNIDQIGQVTLKARGENQPVDYSKIDLGRIKLKVTTQAQDGFYITDEAKEDSWKSDLLFSTRIDESSFAFAKQMEYDVLAAANASQTAADLNLINGQPHRWVGSGTDGGGKRILTQTDFIQLKLSFDKANVPEQGRILVIDPTSEAQFNKLVQLVHTSSFETNNPVVQGILNSGFASNHRFLREFYGFMVFTSNNLPRVGSETINSVAGANLVANIAMCMASAETMPMMGVIRRTPTPEFKRNTDLRRDEWSATARWGYALQRPESLAIILTDETAALV